MRLSPATKVILAAALVMTPAIARAQQLQQQQLSPQMQQQITQMQNQAMGNTQAMMSGPPASAARSARGNSGAQQDFYKVGEGQNLTQDQLDSALKNEESPQSKANRLALQHKYNRDLDKQLSLDAGDDIQPTPPPDLMDLLDLGKGKEGKPESLSDDAGSHDGLPVMDMRRDAQKEAALSFGARGGLAKRNFEIMERMKAFEATLDKVFDFRALLVKAPAGLLIEPPIVRESVDSLVVTSGGNEAAVADRIYDINKQAKIVTAPRDWRAYILQNWVSDVPRPPRLLWPKDAVERARWTRWVNEGWRAGTHQADEMFQANLARLTADFNGMVRYRTLLTQGMISQPYAMHEDRGVTGSKTLMRVGDRALRITGPSQFLTGSDLWKPADR